MDVSKPSDLAVLTGGYFGRGMAKPSATCDGHQRKKEESLRGWGGGGYLPGRAEGPLVYVYFRMCVYVCVPSQPHQCPSVMSGVMCHCHPQGLTLTFEISNFCKRQRLEFSRSRDYLPTLFQRLFKGNRVLLVFFFKLQKTTLHSFLVFPCACTFAQGLHLKYTQLMNKKWMHVCFWLRAVGQQTTCAWKCFWQKEPMCEISHSGPLGASLINRLSNVACQRVNEWVWHLALYLHLKLHPPLWDLPNASKKNICLVKGQGHHAWHSLR